MPHAQIVIVAYRPKPGKQKQLVELVSRHHGLLFREGLVTDRKPICMKADDGCIVEVFEWVSAQAVEQAHQNERVTEMWQAFDDACDYVPIAQVKGADQIFSSFAPV